MVHQAFAKEQEVSWHPKERVTALINQAGMQFNSLNDFAPDVLMLRNPDPILDLLSEILQDKYSQPEAVNTTLPAAAVIMVGDSQIGQCLIGNLLAGDHEGQVRFWVRCAPYG